MQIGSNEVGFKALLNAPFSIPLFARENMFQQTLLQITGQNVAVCLPHRTNLFPIRFHWQIQDKIFNLYKHNYYLVDNISAKIFLVDLPICYTLKAVNL